jgi:serine/threonine protein kinase
VTQSTVKLSDFGLAAVLESKQDYRMSFCGTLDYIAPEMKDKGLYNASVDTWALGMYFCI